MSQEKPLRKTISMTKETAVLIEKMMLHAGVTNASDLIEMSLQRWRRTQVSSSDELPINGRTVTRARETVTACMGYEPSPADIAQQLIDTPTPADVRKVKNVLAAQRRRKRYYERRKERECAK